MMNYFDHGQLTLCTVNMEYALLYNWVNMFNVAETSIIIKGHANNIDIMNVIFSLCLW